MDDLDVVNEYQWKLVWFWIRNGLDFLDIVLLKWILGYNGFWVLIIGLLKWNMDKRLVGMDMDLEIDQWIFIKVDNGLNGLYFGFEFGYLVNGLEFLNWIIMDSIKFDLGKMFDVGSILFLFFFKFDWF